MREKAERLSRAAEQYERGADGERRTAAALAVLPSEEWTVFHDVRWPGRRYANIDHVVVGPPGIFVIDSKNWSGRVTAEGGVLRQNGRRRDAAVRGAAEAAAGVQQLVVAIQAVPVTGVLCFTGGDEIGGRVEDALLCSTGNITAVLASRPPVLLPAVRHDIARQLRTKLADAAALGRISAARPIAAPGRTSARRQAKQNLVSSVVGIVLALGVIASQPQVFDRIGAALVAFMTDDAAPDQPADEPIRQGPKDKPVR